MGLTEAAPTNGSPPRRIQPTRRKQVRYDSFPLHLSNTSLVGDIQDTVEIWRALNETLSKRISRLRKSLRCTSYSRTRNPSIRYQPHDTSCWEELTGNTYAIDGQYLPNDLLAMLRLACRIITNTITLHPATTEVYSYALDTLPVEERQMNNKRLGIEGNSSVSLTSRTALAALAPSHHSQSNSRSRLPSLSLPRNPKA